jgi:molybdopterin-guanine dinucleotide biosynthesis protein B
MRAALPPVLAVSGKSGSGKTRLLVRLVPALVERGLRVGALKHSGHDHLLDKRGKDTARIRAAGAEAVVIQTPGSMALFGPPRASVAELVALLPPVDLVLAEGWKTSALPKLEVHRRVVTPEFLCTTDKDVVAVVTDEPAPRLLPAFDADDVDAIAHFVVGWFAEQASRGASGRARGLSGTSRARSGRARAGARGAVSRRTPAPRAGRRRPAPASR